ncbi:MAG: hypothetical protein QM775_27725 [Pirellulales bacterium]
MSTEMPQVAVWIETSRGYGRGLIRGVASYARQHGPWSIYFTPHGLNEPFSHWLSKWKGDGILARIDDRRMAKMFRAKKVPLIDLRGRLPGLQIPTVGLDNRPVAQMAFEHLRERGFRHFGFCGVPVGEHVHLDQRREFFAERVIAAGFECHIFDCAARRLRRPGSKATAIVAQEFAEADRTHELQRRPRSTVAERLSADRDRGPGSGRRRRRRQR